MAAEKVRIYEPCDKAIMAMNRENLKAFGELKLAKWDQLNVVREITKLYHESARKARKRYFEVAYEAYLIGLAMCGLRGKKAQEMADKAIDMNWVDEKLDQTDFVTLFRFDSETDRKAYRLVEAVAVPDNRNAEIDKALRLWSKQLGQYAINFTDYAVLKAFEDAGIEMVKWISQHDERVCTECYALDGQVFRTDEVPRKPHWGCRCILRPVFRGEDPAEVDAAEAKT